MKTDKIHDPADEASSSAYLLKALIAFSSERGADTGKILRGIEFDAKLLEHEQARVTVRSLNRLWNGIAEALNDPFLGLHFGEALGKQGEGHFLFAIMKNSESLRGAIESLARYHNLMTDIAQPTPAIVNGKLFLEIENRFAAGAVTRHLSEAVLSLLATILRRLTNDEIVFENIFVTHPVEGKDDEYVRIFGKKPVFNSDRNCIVFDEAELNRAFPLAHHGFGTQLQNYAQNLENQLNRPDAYNERILVLLEKCILKGEDCSLKNVAAAFHMSGRHLQNKLKEEGFTYRELRDTARKGIALHCMQAEEVMLCDIAFLLGFSEQSSFNHAFKKWTGLAPREYKETILSGKILKP